jgi:hypothetical protein
MPPKKPAQKKEAPAKPAAKKAPPAKKGAAAPVNEEPTVEEPEVITT